MSVPDAIFILPLMVVPDAARVANVVFVAICTRYHDIPAAASLAPLRESAIVPVTATPLIGVMSVGTVGAVVSRITCLATLYGLSVQAVNNAVIFFVPSPGVKLIACIVYGNGIMSGTQITGLIIDPLTATFVAIFENSAA